MNVVIVGAGAGGTEVAFGLEAWLHGRGVDANVSLVDAHSDVLGGYSAGTVARARREFERRGISLHLGRRVTSISRERGPAVAFDDGTLLPADIIIWATAASPPSE